MTSNAVDALDVIVSRLEHIRARIVGAGGDPSRLRIVAVTKGFGVEVVEAAVGAGLTELGENYAQELVAKAAASPPAVRWHFLGPVQRNKVRRLAPVVATWEAIDRTEAAEAVARARPEAEVMVQVNVVGAPGKAGCCPDEVEKVVWSCRRLGLDLTGLMTVGPVGDVQATRRCFRWLARKANELGLPDLSMGMSDDFEIAVAEGATILRLGRVIFGPRPEHALVQR